MDVYLCIAIIVRGGPVSWVWLIVIREGEGERERVCVCMGPSSKPPAKLKRARFMLLGLSKTKMIRVSREMFFSSSYETGGHFGMIVSRPCPVGKHLPGYVYL